MVGNTSPYNRELNVVAGIQACVRDARCQGADVTLIDTSGLVKGVAGAQLKCAKAESVRPDLIITLSTPGVEMLTGYLQHLGFRIRRFLPIPGHEPKLQKNVRITGYLAIGNSYLGGNPQLMEVDLSRVEVRRWWGEIWYVDIKHVSHGTVAAVQDLRRPDFHIPCVWMVAE